MVSHSGWWSNRHLCRLQWLQLLRAGCIDPPQQQQLRREGEDVQEPQGGKIWNPITRSYETPRSQWNVEIPYQTTMVSFRGCLILGKIWNK